MLDPGQDGGDASLTNRQISILIAIERTGAGFSMAAIVITLVTFVCFKKMRTMPNLFLVFASLANAGASIASMIGYDGLIRGENSSLCQAQAFLMQWYVGPPREAASHASLLTVHAWCRFMQSDPWWSFAMAVNVYLVFFHNADPSSFRKYLWVYCLVCFGGPMVPAIILISIRDDVRGPIFGDAVVSTPLDMASRLLTRVSCGVGSAPNGLSCGSTHTTFPSGCASFCRLLPTLPSDTASFATGIN